MAAARAARLPGNPGFGVAARRRVNAKTAIGDRAETATQADYRTDAKTATQASHRSRAKTAAQAGCQTGPESSSSGQTLAKTGASATVRAGIQASATYGRSATVETGDDG